MEMDDDLVEKMLAAGYLTIVGQNSYGEPLYSFTEKFYAEQSDLVDFMKKSESDTLASLWFKGFIDIKMDEESNPYVYLTGKSDSWYHSDELTSEEKSMMYIIYSTENYYYEEE